MLKPATKSLPRNVRPRLDDSPEVKGNKEEKAFHLMDLDRQETNQVTSNHQKEDFVYDLYYVNDHKLPCQPLKNRHLKVMRLH